MLKLSLLLALLQNPAPEPKHCPITEHILQAKSLVANVPVRHDPTVRSYTEFYRRIDGSLYGKARPDYLWREIPLVLINPNTCELRLTKVRKRLARVENVDPDFTFRIEERTHGKTWDAYNTPFVVTPSPWIVIATKWKVVGKKTSLIYVPFSRTLSDSFPELAVLGPPHVERDIAEAVSELREKQVPSLAFSDSLVADVFETYFQLEAHIAPLMEHSDPQEIFAYSLGNITHSPFRRVYTILGANGASAFNAAVSRAGARGMFQIWPPTALGLQEKYPAADIPLRCENADPNSHRSHIEAMKCLILLDDRHLSELIKAFGHDILKDPDLHRYLIAGYNGGIFRVISAIRHYEERWDRLHCIPNPRTTKRAKRYTTRWYKLNCPHSLLPETISYVRIFDFLTANPDELTAKIEPEIPDSSSTKDPDSLPGNTEQIPQ